MALDIASKEVFFPVTPKMLLWRIDHLIETMFLLSLFSTLSDKLYLYACKSLNKDPISIEYHKIYGSNTKEMKIIIYRIRQSLEKLQTCIKIKQDQKS